MDARERAVSTSAQHSPATSSSASSSSSDRTHAGADGELAASLLREEDGRDAGSPATSTEDATTISAPVAGPSRPAVHRKTSRRRSLDGHRSLREEAAGEDTVMASPPLRRKTPRLDSDDDATHSSRPASSSSSPDQPMRRRRRRRPHIDLAHFPVAELIGPLAHLLQQITAANDAHNAARRSHTSHRASSEASGSGGHTPMIVPPSTPAGDLASGTSYPFPPAGHFSATTSPALTRSGSLASMAMPAPLASLDPDEAGEDMFSASRTAIENPSSTLAYHARNVPTISIEAYLTRILKYCPTTCEVFISLLVFFDRMARTSRPVILDSYNVHRLIIAGVAVSSKLFSDVFYTNQRYSKVGGLPVAELNQLELQFLLLNDFRLLVPVEELQRYADQLAIWAGLVEDDPLEEDEDPADAQGLSVRGDRRPASGSSHASATSTATVRAYASGRDPDADAVAMDEDG